MGIEVGNNCNAEYEGVLDNLAIQLMEGTAKTPRVVVDVDGEIVMSAYANSLVRAVVTNRAPFNSLVRLFGDKGVIANWMLAAYLKDRDGE